MEDHRVTGEEPRSTEYVLLRAQTEALVITLGRRRADRLIRLMADRLFAAGADPRAARARAVFRQHLPTLLELLREMRA